LAEGPPEPLPTVNLNSVSLSPQSVQPGGTVTFHYVIDNPNSASVSVFLGATIFRSGTSVAIDDPVNNQVVTAPVGTSTQTRMFVIPASAAGSYDVLWSIWNQDPVGPSGLLKFDERRQNNTLTVEAAPTPAPQISSLSPSTVVGSSFTLTINGSNFDENGAVDQVYQPNGSFLGQGQIQDRSSTGIVVFQQMAGAAPGNYTVRVKNPDGQESNARTLTLVSQVSVSPSSGTAGTQFSYQGSGFTGSFGVTSHLKKPDGTPFPTLQIPTNSSGQFSQSINSTGFAPGTYEVWAVDDNTGISSNTVSFTVN
jgi:hypothetical protein